MTADPLPLVLGYVALVGLLALVVRVESDAELQAVQQRAWQGDYDGRDVAAVDRDGVTVWTWPEGEG